MLRSNTTASLLSRLQPQTIPKDAAINIIKRSLPHIQAGMETMRDLATQSSIPGIEAIFTLCIAILSYYNKESKTSETITSLGVLIANIANSLTLLIRNPALEPLVVGLEHVLNEVKTVIEEEQKALQEKGFHKVLHVFTKAEKVEKKVVEYHQQLVRARNDLDFRIQVQTHNSIEQIAESFILQRVTVEDGFAGLAERIGTGNEKIMTLLAEILETQVTHAVQPPSGVYEYLGSLMELDGQVDERPILSKSLTVTSIRKDIQESYDPKLNDFDGFTLKLKYTDKKTNRERIVDVNPKMLETCIGSGIYDDVVMLIERVKSSWSRAIRPWGTKTEIGYQRRGFFGCRFRGFIFCPQLH
ncbi:hypothetical protein BDR26DRAFT_653353 [Obelidium mucronatum]|nr:hypothetical protein BDR26DRAFT_653353 [Obelidium mucronatum]